MRQKRLIRTDYLYKVYKTDEFIKTVNQAARKIKRFKKKNDFDAIAFTGTSGAALAYVLSYKLSVPLICIRKNDKNHYGELIEGYTCSKKYLIVDDFIYSGDTIKKIISSLKKEFPKAKPVGIALYASYHSDKPEFWDKIPIISL